VNLKKDSPKVQIVFEDSRSTAKDGVSAYHKLRLQNIQYIITSLTIVSEAVRPLSEKDNVLQIALSVHPDIAKSSNTLLRIYYGLEDEMKLIADYLSEVGAKKVAALYVNTPEDDLAINYYFKSYLASKNIEFIGSETYEFADKSLRNQLIKLKALNPDFIMTIDFGYMYPTMLKEAQSLGIREKILGGLGMMTAPSMPTELTKDIVFASASFVIDPTERYLEFDKRYEQKYGKRVTFDGVYTYEAFYILHENLRMGTTRYENFLSRTFDGISGKMFIDSTGTAKVDISIAKFDNTGKIVKLR
jgi:ABC-type branched-subunit amino acid transport system substrate-binding protein